MEPFTGDRFVDGSPNLPVEFECLLDGCFSRDRGDENGIGIGMMNISKARVARLYAVKQPTAENASKAPVARTRATRCALQSLTPFVPSSAYVAELRPRDCPVEFHPTAPPEDGPALTSFAARAATSMLPLVPLAGTHPHLTPPQPRRSRFQRSRRPSRAGRGPPARFRARRPLGRAHSVACTDRRG